MIFKCDRCDYESTSYNLLRRHIKVEHDNKKLFTCDNCNRQFTQISALNVHFNNFHTEHSEEDLTCGICGYKATSKQRLRQHKTKAHRQKKLNECERCDYTNEKIAAVELHVKTFHFDMRYPCYHCDFETNSTKNMDRHMSYIHYKERFKCQKCEASYGARAKLNAHIRRIHSVTL